MEHENIRSFLFSLQAKGQYTISLKELRKNINSPNKAIQQSLYRLKKQKKIVQIRKGFYAIIPPEYSRLGALPVVLFLNDLMKYLDRDYYLGLYSAAALHGAAHQQPMASQVIITKPNLRPIKGDKNVLTFFVRKKWDVIWVEQKKTDAGYINVSSPELTIVDLINHHNKIGGLNRMMPILEDLSEVLKIRKLSIVVNHCSLPTNQRLGYLLEQLEMTKLSLMLERKLKNKKTTKVPLSLSHSKTTGDTNKKWNLIINTQLDL